MLNDKNNKNSSYLEKLNNSANEIDYVYGLENITVNKNKEWIIYSLCKNSKCLAYVVNSDFDSHILSLNGTGIGSKYFLQLISRGLCVES